MMYNYIQRVVEGESMDEDESLNEPKAWQGEERRRRHVSPYELLLRQSRKMGRTATRTYDITRQFLNKDITLRNPLQLPQTDASRSAKKLNRIVTQSQEVLAEAETVILPNNLFPDSVVVDRSMVTITKRTFFWSAEVISIRIEDVLNVTSSVGPFFGSLTISTRVMNSTDHYAINYFWRKDAIRLKHFIHGYIIAIHNGVDTSQLTKDQLIKELSQLGSEPHA
jgi:hypothetical protein